MTAPPDHAPQPPLAEGEREVESDKYKRGQAQVEEAEAVLADPLLYCADLTDVPVSVPRLYLRIFRAKISLLNAVCEVRTRERDAGVEQGAKLRTALREIYDFAKRHEEDVGAQVVLGIIEDAIGDIGGVAQ